MTIDASSIVALIDRFGLPTVYLGVLGWLAYKAITGPAMRLAVAMGDGFSTLAKSGSEFLVRLTASMEKQHLEHTELGARTDAGVAAIKAHVSAESVATREHVAASVASLRDRVSAAEDSIEVTVRQVTGEHAAYRDDARPSVRESPTVRERQPGGTR
jgi:hypothetical protein